LGLQFSIRGGVCPDLILHEEMEGNPSNQDHQDDDYPVDRMLEDLKVDDLIHGGLRGCFASLALLINLSYGSQDRESERNHEQNGDPIRRIPAYDGLFSHKFSLWVAAQPLLSPRCNRAAPLIHRPSSLSQLARYFKAFC
jgi:hypothetical protein